MARNIYYVNTNSTSGGDGTTNLTTGGTRAFPTIRNALTSITDDLSLITTDSVTIKGYQFTNIAVEIICDNAGGDDTEKGANYGIELGNDAGYTNASNTKRILIRAADNSWHDNLKLNTGYRYAADAGLNRYLLWVSTNGGPGHFCFAGLEFYENGTNDTPAMGGANSGSTDVVKTQFFSCIFNVNNTSFRCVEPDSNCWYFCCRFHQGAGINGLTTSWRSQILNCIATDSGVEGIGSNGSVDGTCVMINNVGWNSTTNDFETGMTYLDADYNASEDLTGDDYGSNGITGLVSGDFVNTAGDDYQPSASSALDDAGEDLVTAGYVANRVDAMGTTRPTGNTWAIGPLETATAPSGTLLGSLAGEGGLAGHGGIAGKGGGLA